MSKTPLTRADGSIIYVEPGMVDTISEYQVVPPLSFITFVAEGDETRETVQGTPAAVAALLDAGQTYQLIQTGGYGPPGTPVSGPISFIAGFGASFSRVGQVVQLAARFEVTFASSGTCSFSFPAPTSPGLPFVPGTVRGVVSYSDNPYTGAPNMDPEAIVYESGGDFVVEFGNGSGGPKRFSILLQYQTP